MKTVTGITKDLELTQIIKLDSFAIHYNNIMHRMYVDLFIKKIPYKDISVLYQSKYLISRRHFDSIYKVLNGKVSSIISLNKTNMDETKFKINIIEKTILKQRKTYETYKAKLKIMDLNSIESKLKAKLQSKIAFNKKRLDKLKNKLIILERIRNTGNIKICFGSNNLFREQFKIKSNSVQTKFKNHEDWYKEWNYQRNKNFILIGSKDEVAGNSNAQITHIEGNLFNLRININHKCNNIDDKYINIQFNLNYESDKIKQIIINNQGREKKLWQALTYNIIKQNSKNHKNKYIVAISFEKNLIKNIVTSKKYGCIGVDINQNNLAVTNLDNKGNLLNIYNFYYNLNGTKDQNTNSISLAIKNLIKLGSNLNKPIVIEKLDFNLKKIQLNYSESFKNKKIQLNSFAYNKVIELIKNRAIDNSIEIIEVDPAYTSLIGYLKYSTRNRISIHHSAAICIARKGLFKKHIMIKATNNRTNEKYDKTISLNHIEKRISSNNKYIKTSNLPERNNLKLGIYWKELRDNIIKNKKLSQKILLKQKQHE